MREEIKGKQRKLKEYNNAVIDRNKGDAVSTGGSAVRADKSCCYQRRQFALPLDQFSCTRNHDESPVTLFYCWRLPLHKNLKCVSVIVLE